MRERGTVAVVASVLAHVGLVAGLAMESEAVTAAPPPAPIEIVPVPLEVVPIEFVIVEAPSAPAPRSGSGHGHGHGHGHGARAGRSEIAVGGRDGVAESAGTPAPQVASAIDVPIGAMIDIAHGGGGVVIRTKPATSEDSTTALKIDADGTAHFADKGSAEVHMIVPASGNDLVDLIDAWSADPLAHTREDGTIANEAAKTGIVPILGGTFGGGPDRARKQRLLEQTFDQRAEQRANHVAEQQGKADMLMRRNLERLWGRVTDPEQRRQLLFELWDECDEGDDAAGAAGERARRQVIAWIRARLPAGSPDAYSGDDISALNRRRNSTQRFRPY